MAKPPLVASASKCLGELVLERELDRFDPWSARQVLDVLAQTDDKRLDCGILGHGVALHRLDLYPAALKSAHTKA
jgi:hypothetical protein